APAGSDVRVVGWRHLGADPNGLHGRYKHERVADRDVPGSPRKKGPDPLPKPTEVYDADLGGGVSCHVPLALFADAKGTIPKASAKPRLPVKPTDFPPTGDDRATRLACVCLAWGVFQHFYPYFEETKADWPTALTEALTAAATDPDAAAFNLTLRRLIARLEDSHGSVRPGSGAPRYDGALPLSWDVVESKLAVTWVDPAAKNRVKVGDVVEAIDGVAARERVKAASRVASGATPEHRRYRTCADLRIGPAGQPVKLDFRTPKGEAYSLTIERRLADDSPLRGPSMREPGTEAFARVAPGVVYLDLDRLRDEKFHAALAEARKAEGVVFDVRGYPLAYLTWLRLLADKPLIEDQYGDVLNPLPDRRGMRIEPAKNPPFPPQAVWRAKIAFVTDGRAVSYAETFLAVVENTKLGTIVGEPTAGSNGGIALYVLPDGTRVSWTGQKVVRADGSRLHGVGIRPAVPVRRTLKGLAEGRDEALERAIELVRPAGKPEKKG
ncbi:MAG TPA: S41 family peptidase, partial [Gemmataceae bacterium]|nr:S41 family peptidase [Gemmataceae bacterium]